MGHAIEGKRPSFFKDVQFLLIGPLWLVALKRDDDAARLDRQQEDHCLGADVVVEASRSAKRAADHGLRQDR